MSRKLIKQDTQISSSTVYNSTVSGVNQQSVAEPTVSGSLEGDLNIIRTLLKEVKSTTNWYDTPVSNIATLDTKINSTSGTLQNQIDNILPTQSGHAGEFLTTDGTTATWSGVSGGTSNHSELNELDYASAGHTGFASGEEVNQNTWDISVISGTVMTPVEVTTSTHTATANTIININYSGNVTVTLPNPNLTYYTKHERIIINDVYGYFGDKVLTVNVANSQSVLTRQNDWNWYQSMTFSGRYFSYEFTRTSAYSWQLTDGEGTYKPVVVNSSSYYAKRWDEVHVNLSIATTIYLPPVNGGGGVSVRIIDTNNSFSTNPCTVNGNGNGIAIKNAQGTVNSVTLDTANGVYDFYITDSNTWYFTDTTKDCLHLALSSNTFVPYGQKIISADTSGGSFYLDFDGGSWSDGSQVTIVDVKGTFSTNNLQIKTTPNTFVGPAITNGTSVYLDIDYGVYVVTYDDTNSVFIVESPGATDHSALSELDYASAGHTGFASSTDLTTTSGFLQNELNKFRSSYGITTYYLHNESSDIGGYEYLKIDPAESITGYDQVVIKNTDGETLIDQYITVSGTPATTLITAGIWNMHLWAYIDNIVGTNYIRAKWYKYNAVSETHLFTQECLLTDSDLNFYAVETVNSGIALDVNDRLSVKIYAQTSSGANRTFRFYYEGSDSYTHFDTPVITELTNDHNLLNNLDYASAGHTGFASSTDLSTTSGTLQSQINDITHSLYKSMTIKNPSGSEVIDWFYTNTAITVAAIESVLRGSTPAVTLNVAHNTNITASGNNVCAADRTVTNTTDGTDLVLGGDITIPSSSFVWVTTSSVSGTVNSAHLTLRYTED